jgi:sugar O-acyltransferase (sialic acid O-acetyltransferase NeuD family)
MMKNNKRKIAIFGTSGFSREVLDICVDIGIEEIVFLVSDDATKEYFGHETFSEEKILKLQKNGFSFIVGIGDNKIRKNIYSKYPTLKYVNVIHSAASFGDKQKTKMEIKQGNVATAGVRMTNNIQIGSFGIFNLNCTVGHDCIFEDFVNIAPSANISGNVIVCEGAYIGTNATILQGKSITEKIRIGRYATVGAGAVVTKNVQDFSVVIGVPAREIKD